MKILVIHGPNMPLLGKVSMKSGTRLTLDKLDKAIRKEATAAGIEIKVFQFYNEERILKTISRNRKEISGILINPGPLARTAFGLRELLGMLKIPTAEVCIEEFPFSDETFSKSVIKDVVTARFIGAGAEPYLHGLNALLK